MCASEKGPFVSVAERSSQANLTAAAEAAMTPQDRLPGSHLRTADSREGPLCGCMEGAGPWAALEARGPVRTDTTPITSFVASFEGVITLEGPGTRDA